MLGVDFAETVIKTVMNKELVISLDSPVFSQWIDPAPPIYMQYWFFQVDNPEFILKGEKPILSEVGPFTYRFYQPKTEVAFYTNSTVGYKYNHTLVFQPDMSPGVNESTPILQINLPLLTVASLLKKKNFPDWATSMVSTLADAANDSSLFVEHSASEFLFGYEDPLLKMVHDAASLVHIDFPSEFGVFYGYNNSDDGVYLAKTGADDVKTANTLEKWNYAKSLDFWYNDEANMINGTDGTFFNPRISKDDRLYLYNSDICRSIYLQYDRESSVLDIPTLRFRVPPEVFQSPSKNPANAGFCPVDDCLDDGVLEISSCKEGAPVIMSCPHFYSGAPEYINAVVGMHPSEEEHGTYLDVEPQSGATFKAAKRLQANAHLLKDESFTELANVNDVIFPVLWLNESVTLDTDTAHTYKSTVIPLENFVYAIPYLMLGVGLLIAAFASFLIVNERRNRLKFELLDETVNGDSETDS